MKKIVNSVLLGLFSILAFVLGCSEKDCESYDYYGIRICETDSDCPDVANCYCNWEHPKEIDDCGTERGTCAPRDADAGVDAGIDCTGQF